MDGVGPFDRIAGRPAERVEGPVALGRFVFVPGGHAYSLNGRLVRAGDALAVDGEWRLRDEASGAEVAGDHGPRPLPSDLTVDWTRSTGREVEALGARAAALTELEQLSPILDDERARAVLARQPLEDATADHHRYLHAVCFRPASRLRAIDRMLPVSAARRITPRTVARLAAHSEDWALRRPGGVQPEQVLVPQREIDVDFYENRVSVRLVDHLVRYLDARIAAVDGIGDWFLGVEHYAEQMRNRSWRVSQRLGRMLRDLAQTERWATLVDRRRRELERLRGLVHGLSGSPLWGAVNRRAALDTTLRATNLFVNEDRYRHVETLWRAWVAAELDARSAADRHQRLQEWYQGFTACAALLLIRAFEEVGLEPEPGEAAPAPGRSTIHRVGGTTLTLTWLPEGIFVLERDGAAVQRVVPLPHALTASRESETVDAALRGLGPAGETPTVLLYPGARVEREALSTAVRLRAFEGPGSPAPGRPAGAPFATPVSPLEIDSVGRVARVVRWAVWSGRLVEYPVQVATEGVPASELAAGLPFLQAGARSVELTKVPSDAELDVLRQRVFAHQHDTARFMRRGDNTEQIARLWDRVERGVKRMRELTCCPRCGRSAPAPERALQPRENATYTCACEHCEAEWETRRCQTCGAAYPVLRVTTGGTGQVEAHGDRLDELFAGDLLTAPCWVRPRVYPCPACGTCAGAASEDAARCRRCR
jgi:hypothetical protein